MKRAVGEEKHFFSRLYLLTGWDNFLPYMFFGLRLSLQLQFYVSIGVRAGGARGAAAPPNFGQLRFFGQHEKIWAKPVFKDVSMFLLLF